MAKAEEQTEKEQTEPTQSTCAAGDDADTAHLREAKRVFNRQVERAAKRQHERKVG